jgi:thioredoxin 1
MTQTQLIHEPTAQDFDTLVLNSTEPVLVDFWAEWCGPCKRLGPIVEELAAEHAGRLRVAKVNVDEQPELGQRFAVQSIPTLLFFKGGKLVDRAVGALPKGVLETKIKGLT